MSYKNAFKYIQEGQEFFSLILSLKELVDITQVLVYGESEYGYQRSLNKKHIRDLKKSIIEYKNLASPTSIVLGLNRSDYEKIKIEQLDDQIIKIDLKDKGKIFRIIDGQHRLAAFESAAKEKLSLYEYMFNVVVLIVEDDKRIVEVNTFSDINSKAKPLKMDLTILAKYNYELIERSGNIEIEEYLAANVCHKLNQDKDGGNIWGNGIKLDVNISKSLGIIGFKSFYESIKPICKFYKDKYYTNDTQLSNNDKISYIEEIADRVKFEILDKYWGIIHKKWPGCFEKNLVLYNNEDHTIYYKNDYYIQKAIGVKSLHLLLKETLKENDYDINKSFKKLDSIIENCELTDNDWKKGGRFSGLNSESGFKKIADLIQSSQKKNK